MAAELRVKCSSVEEEVASGPLQMGGAREEVLRRVAGALDLLGIALLRDRGLREGLDELAEAVHEPAHYLNRARHLDDDPQPRAAHAPAPGRPRGPGAALR